MRTMEARYSLAAPAVLVACALLSAPAAAQGASAQVWTEAPSAAAVMAVWPREAARKGRHGDALGRCRIQGAAQAAGVRRRPAGARRVKASVTVPMRFEAAPKGR
ncbi:hypothetical protein [Phenylobacterium sp.]|uniref:hypothetical protein n=1 Tax=Phenylobacterium sp. TaxID=1871053 RepID=UPI002F922908